MPRPAAQGRWPITITSGVRMADIEQHDDIQVFLAVDVGKANHHAVALDRMGKRLLDSGLPNDEAKLRALIGKLKQHGPILLVVDQPATVGALPVAVARAEGALVGVSPPGWRCVASPICMPVKPRPMPVTPTSSPRPPAACRTRCAR